MITSQICLRARSAHASVGPPSCQCLTQEFRILNANGMTEVAPVLDATFDTTTPWDVLEERWSLLK